MTGYGTGGVLGTATLLPATSAAGIIIIHNANPLIVAGFIVVNILSLCVIVSYITRFVVNNKYNS